MQRKTITSTASITPRQLQLLKAISTFTLSHCYSPTIAELAEKLQLSRSTVFEHVEELQRKRLLSNSPGKARSLKATSKARRLLETLESNAPRFASDTSVPLAGRVAAGSPIEAIEDKSFLSLNSHFAGDNIFALEVSGDSMVGDDIHDGDYVICRKSPAANNGQLVIAITDNENATLKRFYREKNRVRLQPSNDAYQPIYSDNCRIEAVVVGLVRKF
jgi:repressor LexA